MAQLQKEFTSYLGSKQKAQNLIVVTFNLFSDIFKYTQCYLCHPECSLRPEVSAQREADWVPERHGDPLHRGLDHDEDGLGHLAVDLPPRHPPLLSVVVAASILLPVLL